MSIQRLNLEHFQYVNSLRYSVRVRETTYLAYQSFVGYESTEIKGQPKGIILNLN